MTQSMQARNWRDLIRPKSLVEEDRDGWYVAAHGGWSFTGGQITASSQTTVDGQVVDLGGVAGVDALLLA